MKTSILICSLVLISNVALAQASLERLTPDQYFDFWIGKWHLTWETSGGSVEHGTNTIEKVLDGKVIKENFEATSGTVEGYIGKSYSVYNPQTGEWKQTWVDNNGSYLDFTGKFEDDKRIFIRETTDKDGNLVVQRMVFYQIEANSFLWNWEQSIDNGKNWQLQWKIAYRRH